MALMYTKHAEGRMRDRGITTAQVEAAVEKDKEPWEQVLNGGNHKRYFYENVTAITNLRSDTVVTVWKGERGGW